MSGRAYTGLLGIIAAIIGVILLFVPVHVSIGINSLSCGNALHEDFSGALQSASSTTEGMLALAHAQAGDLTYADQVNAGVEAQNDRDVASQIASGCDSNVGTRRIVAWLLAGLGVVVALGAMVIRRQPVPPSTVD